MFYRCEREVIPGAISGYIVIIILRINRHGMGHNFLENLNTEFATNIQIMRYGRNDVKYPPKGSIAGSCRAIFLQIVYYRLCYTLT